MLKFAKRAIYLPDPVRSRPPITDAERDLAKTDPPHPVPFHCKPWLDGHTVGWTLFYGYLTPIIITGLAEGKIEVTGLPDLVREAGTERVFTHFAPGYFSLSTGYTLRTPSGMVSLVIPATQTPQGLNVLTAVLETAWFPKEMFIACHTPPPGQQVYLDYNMELARVVVIPYEGNLRGQATAMSDEEFAQVLAEEDAYVAEERASSTSWQAATGGHFSHIYKLWSNRRRR
jgi:hypothetical protein